MTDINHNSGTSTRFGSAGLSEITGLGSIPSVKSKKPLQEPYSSFSLDSNAKFIAASLVFLFSLIIIRYYTDGDQRVYRLVYEGLADRDLEDGFSFYSINLSSKEYIHFFLSWLASRYVDKDLFINVSNALLAYVSMGLFQKWRAPTVVALVILLSNVYFLGMYFAAERLKYAFIFLVLSMLYVHKVKHMLGFAALAILSHAQVLIIYAAILLNLLVKRESNVFRTGNVLTRLCFVSISIIPVLLIGEHAVAKFQTFYSERDLMALSRIGAFFLLALWYSRNRLETSLIFIPIGAAVFLVGGDRVNIFGYFVFLYYGFQYRRGWNVGVLVTTAYFFNSSLQFLLNVINYGDGFYNEWF